MILNSPYISGSLTVTGNTVLSGSVTLAAGTSLAGTASLATSASFAVQAQTASFVANAQSASNAVTAQTASYANALTVAGTLTAQTLVVQTITSSVDYVTGSTRFGSLSSNTHVFTGSLYVTGAFYIPTGSVGIGTSNPPTKLHVAGYGSVGTGFYSSTGIPSLGFANSSSVTLFTNGDTNYGTLFGTLNTGNGWIQQQRVDGTGTAYNLLLQPNGGYVGIGTTSPSVLLQVEGSSSTSLTPLYLVNSSTAAVTTKQNNLSFRMTDTVGTRKNAFQLTAYSDSSGGNIENGGLIFSGRKTDVDTEFMRITSGGQVSITSAGSTVLNLLNTAGTGNRNWRFVTNDITAGDVSIQQSTTDQGSTYVSRFNIINKDVSIPFTTWTTFYTTDTYYGGMYFVTIGLNGQSTTDWTACAMFYAGASSDMLYAVGPLNGTYVQIRKTGNSIQVYQNGTSPNVTMTYRVMRFN